LAVRAMNVGWSSRENGRTPIITDRNEPISASGVSGKLSGYSLLNRGPAKRSDARARRTSTSIDGPTGAGFDGGVDVSGVSSGMSASCAKVAVGSLCQDGMRMMPRASWRDNVAITPILATIQKLLNFARMTKFARRQAGTTSATWAEPPA